MPGVSYNERSWAIDLIAHVKGRTRTENRAIRDAGGEQTIRSEGGSLFPDVLLFGDHSAAIILQGWELKLPNTNIDDNGFYQNAVKKAKALGLDSFVLWNVTCARLYTRSTETSQYLLFKQWPKLDHISDRESVLRNRGDWEQLADIIISDLNALFEDGDLEGRPFIDAYRTGGIQDLILANTTEVANDLKQNALRNSTLRAEITVWWQKYRQEYKYWRKSKYQVLAQANLYNWIGKFLFAHVLQSRDMRASIVTTITEEVSPTDALGIFRDLSRHCNFWTVFSESIGLAIVSQRSWYQLTQFNNLLTDLRIGSIDQTQLSIVLEVAVETAIRKVRGQYATPPALAKIIVALALRNIISDRMMDPCCGSGTIARTALESKLEANVRPMEAAATVLAGDLDPQATQIAALAMAKPSLMDVPLRVFCKDAFHLDPLSEIEFQNPRDGSDFKESLGSFNAIASNLPFVSQGGRSYYTIGINQVTELLREHPIQLSGRADIAAYFPFALHRLLAEKGRLVIIISNAWLSTEWGEAFYELILRYYTIKSIVTSGAGRWFQNSKVVANLVLMEKRGNEEKADESIDFVVLKRPLQEVADSHEMISITSAQIELGQAEDENMSLRSVRRSELDVLRERGLGHNAHFVDCDWARELPLTALRNLCTIHRGERRGWDEMFYPVGDHDIEKEYIQPVLKSPTEISGIMSTANKEAFCCSISIKELEDMQHIGALQWIRRFEAETNNTNQPLPVVLAKPGMFWYEMQTRSTAELVMPINFGERLFVARPDPPAFVNQRFTRLNSLPGVDIDLLVALLNCAISLFFIEGLGFGRGEGALDLSATRIKRAMHVLDPQCLTSDQVLSIKSAFKPLLSREVLRVVDEFELKDRQHFDDAVIEAFGLPVSRERVYESLIRLVAIRLTATELPK